MNSRLHDLEKKKYVIKLGSVYKLGLKGTCALMLVAPDILSQFPESFWQDDAEPDIEFREPEYWPKNGKAFRESTVERFHYNTIASKTFSFAARETLWTLKINLDDIEPQQLWDLFNDILTKIYQKNKKKFRKIY